MLANGTSLPYDTTKPLIEACLLTASYVVAVVKAVSHSMLQLTCIVKDTMSAVVKMYNSLVYFYCKQRFCK